MTAITRFEADGVRGFLHRPDGAATDGLVLTHGAGGNCEAPVLLAAAEACVAAGLTVLRCDLPFRQKRPKGPPSPAGAAADRTGLRAAATALRTLAPGRLLLGGHSYGGRQASMLSADDPTVADALLLLSYPLHPPNKPAQLRTAHFPQLRTPSLFVHGVADPFATSAELAAAAAAIPAATRIFEIAGAGHDLKRGRLDFVPIIDALRESVA